MGGRGVRQQTEVPGPRGLPASLRVKGQPLVAAVRAQGRVGWSGGRESCSSRGSAGEKLGELGEPLGGSPSDRGEAGRGLRRPKRGLGSLGLHLLLCLKFKSYTLQKKLQTNEISLSGQKRPRGCIDVRVLGPWWWESGLGVWMLGIQPLRATASDLPGLGVLSGGGKALVNL